MAQRSLYFVLFFLIPLAHLSAQAPASGVLRANRVKATFNANGALFTDFQSGQFIAPYAHGQPEISLLRAAGLWLAGTDPGGNLNGAIQLYNEGGKTDFIPGTLDESGQPIVSGPTGIFRVTRAEIEAHKADFADNGVIDNPQPGVFGWPGHHNPFFAQYHDGHNLPATSQGFAGFFDADFDGIYDPAKGDYPVIEIRGCHLNRVPTEMLWFAFHDAAAHPESNLSPIRMEVQCQIFAYDCTEESPLRNSIFVRYKLINRSLEPLADFYAGLFNDFDIGSPGDDFVGTDPARNLVFGYNGDDLDEAGFGANIPVLGVKMLRGPLDTLGHDLPLTHVTAYDPATAAGALQYYNLLRGLNPNGSPAPNNGILYPGNPGIPGSNSETGVGNIPGQRRAVASYGPFTLLPGAVNELIAGYFYTQEAGKTPLQNVQNLYAQSDALQAYFDNCFNTTDCLATVSAPEVVDVPGLLVFPNPASQSLTVQSAYQGFLRIQLSDVAGRVVYSEHWAAPRQKAVVPVSALPAGVYFAGIGLPGGQVHWEKVVVAR